MAELVARIDGQWTVFQLSYSRSDRVDSTALLTFGSTKRGIHAICLSVDELLIDAGDQCTEHYSHVGHIPGQSRSFLLRFFDVGPIHFPFQAEGPDAFSQFHLYVCSAFLVKWSEKLRQMDFQVTILAIVSDIVLTCRSGHHHVSTMPTDTGLGGS